MSLLEFRWRIGLYTKQQSMDRVTSGLSRAKTVKTSLMLLEVWPTIGDESFNIGNTKEGKKAPIESLRLTSTIDIAFTPMRSFETSPIGLLSELMNALSVEPPPCVFKKKSLIAIGVIMELHNGGCCWPATREAEVKEKDKGGGGIHQGRYGVSVPVLHKKPQRNKVQYAVHHSPVQPCCYRNLIIQQASTSGTQTNEAPVYDSDGSAEDDLDEEEAIKVTEKKNLEIDIDDETLEIDEIVNIKESKNHPLDNVIENLNQRTLRNKLDENDIVSWNKARVAQGYNQQEGIDYDKTYALVARLESIRILLAYACALDFKLF
nr:copia protein [Tanacetum cinerariifolium]